MGGFFDNLHNCYFFVDHSKNMEESQKDLNHSKLLDIATSITELANEPINLNLYDFMSVWLRRNPGIGHKQDCIEMISGKMNSELLQEILYAAKLSLIAYAMPYYIPEISTQLYLKNTSFMNFFEMMQADQYAYSHMDKLLSQQETSILLPENNQLAGFYIRTPIRLWNKNHQTVYKVPSWKQRSKLLKLFVVGNVNVYVLRKNVETGFELYVLFRGTSNEFNGIPQYGDNMKNTQIYHVPDFNIETQTFYKTGSETIPLFYFYYCNMILDVKEYIYKALEQLGVESELCQRVLITGHSMGGGLSVVFNYTSYFERPQYWHKFKFRQFASPLCCNDSAVRFMEEITIQSKTKNKIIEVVNKDDIVNVQYMFGGRQEFLKSLSSGTSSVMGWIVKNHFKEIKHSETMVENALRIFQLNPEAMLAMFLNAASQKQISISSKNRILPKRFDINQKHQDSLNVVYCSRNYKDKDEYLGKSHVNYVDVSMNLFWTPLRMYENSLYEFYSQRGLKQQNNLLIIPMFSKIDLFNTAILVKEQQHIKPWIPSNDLMNQFFR
jgi:hypothetical protein